jgi:siroheme synthase (precorrin-2 oxidase/ferrochelatase)
MTRSVLLLLIIAACAAGCTPAYTVHMNTFSQIQEPPSQTTPIYVSIDPNSHNPILADVIAAKIRALLEEHGYTAAEKAADAGYVLTFRGGIDSTGVMDYLPVARPFGEFHGFYGGGFRGLGYGYTTYVPYIETVYAHWMDMRLFAQGPNAKDRTRPIWIGEAVVGRSDPEMRDSVNYLLIGLFEYFGTDTRRWLTMTIKEDDPRIEALAGIQ